MWRDARPGKNGVSYVNGIDADNGGDIKLVFEGRLPAGMFMPDGKMNPTPQPFEAVVKGQTYNLAVSQHVTEWVVLAPAK